MPSAQSWVPSLYMCIRMRCARAGGVLSVTVCLIIHVGDGLIWRGPRGLAVWRRWWRWGRRVEPMTASGRGYVLGASTHLVWTDMFVCTPYK